MVEYELFDYNKHFLKTHLSLNMVFNGGCIVVMYSNLSRGRRM